LKFDFGHEGAGNKLSVMYSINILLETVLAVKDQSTGCSWRATIGVRSK
jgi:hypothetical protein